MALVTTSLWSPCTAVTMKLDRPAWVSVTTSMPIVRPPLYWGVISSLAVVPWPSSATPRPGRLRSDGGSGTGVGPEGWPLLPLSVEQALRMRITAAGQRPVAGRIIARSCYRGSVHWEITHSGWGRAALSYPDSFWWSKGPPEESGSGRCDQPVQATPEQADGMRAPTVGRNLARADRRFTE